MKLFTPERLYALIMWVLSLVLAGFLIGLGGLVLGDLPRVEQNLTVAQFVDTQSRHGIAERRADLMERQRALFQERIARDEELQSARQAYGVIRDEFASWRQTRGATGDAAQNAELVRRSNELDAMRRALAITQGRLDQLESQIAANERAELQLAAEDQTLEDTAQPAYERAVLMQQARVFGMRLAFTLPLLVVSGWLIKTKRQSRYWPLARGFVLASLFAFFIELVPYLPSYGGYVRYIVGIVVTLVIGHYLVRWMRAYLQQRQQERLVSEDERRRSMDYDAALTKANKGLCPGCERSIERADGIETNFCAHCGLKLYENCPNCDTRKLVFHHYCLKCGGKTDGAGNPGAVPAPA